MKIILLIRSLDVGGAERQLVELAKGLAGRGHEVKVALFYAGGPLHSELKESGISTVDLAKKGRWDILSFVGKLLRLIRSDCPDILYCFMGTPNTLGAFLKPLIGRTRLVWGVRASDMDLARYDRLGDYAYRVECRLSRFADLIIANSRAGVEHAVRNGFPRERMQIVPNGIDTARFRPDPALRSRSRQAFGLKTGELAIGVLARIDPMKDYPNFLRAAALLSVRHRNLRFLCIGGGSDEQVRALGNLARELGIESVLQITGLQEPVTALNALDISCSSSSSEGFSNAVGEAMACGVPCVVTDVGDSALIIGDSGILVPASDPEALASGLERMMDRIGAEASASCRSRIEKNFSIAAMVDRTLALFGEALSGPDRARG